MKKTKTGALIGSLLVLATGCFVAAACTSEDAKSDIGGTTSLTDIVRSEQEDASVNGMSYTSALSYAGQTARSSYHTHNFDNNVCTVCGAIDTSAIVEGSGSTVAVHDPSVITAYADSDGNVYPNSGTGRTKIYFIFGTQLAAAYSFDMESWAAFTPTFYEEDTTTVSKDYTAIFETPAAWSGWTALKDITDNLWAPDIIYNTDLGKWCLYYSMNGDNWMSSVFMMTADNITGPYEYAGFVVFSGMTNRTSGAGNTDYATVTGSSTVASRYLSGTSWTGTYGSSCIDPTVIYDNSGELWLFYGSWSGGIFLIKLDNETGLRDLSYNYGYTNFSSDGAVWDGTALVYDPYMGIHIAGGYYVSGEGSYVAYIDGYYYLYLSYGFYSPEGGYNMRVFRSSSVTGRYVDVTGDWAVYSQYVFNYGDNVQNGISIMQNYKWSWWEIPAQVAQGHNSLLVDGDKAYVVYHTKYDNGSAAHNVEVHQLVKNADGWYLIAPFQKSSDDEIVTNKGVGDLAGNWGVIVHNSVDYASLASNTEEALALKSDGTISGLYTGTWSVSGSYITLNTNEAGTFKGVLMRQRMEGLDTAVTTYTFTAINANELCIWGALYPTGDDAVDSAAARITLPSELLGSINFETSGLWGAVVSYQSSNQAVLSNTGEFHAPATDTNVTVTVTIQCGTATRTKTFTIACLSDSTVEDRLNVIDGDYILNTYGQLKAGSILPATDSINVNTGVSISFTVSDLSSDWDVIYRTFDGKAVGYLSILNYQGESIFEASATASSAANSILTAHGLPTDGSANWQLFLGSLCNGGSSCLVTVSYNTDGSVSFYRDGALMLTYSADMSIGSYKVKDLSSYIVSQLRTNGLYVGYTLDNVVVAYAADFDINSYVPPADSRTAIKVIGSDNGNGTYTHAFNVWDCQETVSGDFTLIYNVNVKAPSLTTDPMVYYKNWLLKIDNWVLRADFWSMDASNNMAALDGVVYSSYFNWNDYCEMYEDANVTLVVSRSGTTITVTATIEPVALGSSTYTYTATLSGASGNDIQISLGGEDCLITVYSILNGKAGSVSQSTSVASNANVTAETGLSVSFWLANSSAESSWSSLINANGYIVTYGNLDSYTVNGHNCYPSLTAHNGAWNALIYTDPAYITISVSEDGISFYKNGDLVIYYAPTDTMNDASGSGTTLHVSDFIAAFLDKVEDNGFTFAQTAYTISDLTVGTSLSLEEVQALYRQNS